MTDEVSEFKKRYYKSLQSKRWDRLRYYVIKRDGKKCSLCQSKYKLNVHHMYYIDGNLAYEYHPDVLITLCEDCHKKWHDEHGIIVKPKNNKPTSRKGKRKNDRNRYNDLPRKLKDRIKSKTPPLVVTQDTKPKYRKKVDGKWVEISTAAS